MVSSLIDLRLNLISRLPIVNYLGWVNRIFLMSISYEYLRKMYPEWESKISPFLPLLEIFAAIAFFLLIPYALMKLFKHDVEVSETEEIDSTEIDDWFAFRKTYQTPK